MKLDTLIRGAPGHPLHPPLTDATIGAYVAAAAFAVLAVAGVSPGNMAAAWWLALVAGLVLTVPTALTGFADWLTISWGTPLWRTATTHMLAVVAAAGVFLAAALIGHGDYVDRDVSALGLGLTVAGLAVLTLGGWLGGTIVFVHGMRVLNLVDLPAAEAAAPSPSEDKPKAA